MDKILLRKRALIESVINLLKASCQIPPLGFAADKEHPETKNLAKKYRSIREKINIAYSQEPPFEVIMRMLANSKSSTVLQKRCSELPIAPAKMDQ